MKYEWLSNNTVKTPQGILHPKTAIDLLETIIEDRDKKIAQYEDAFDYIEAQVGDIDNDRFCTIKNTYEDVNRVARTRDMYGD